MPITVTMPQLGESVTEGTITRWLKNVGDTVNADEPLLEVSTDKVDTEIPSPASGVLLVKTLWAAVAYAGLALTLHVLDRHERDDSGEPGGLSSPELSARNQRISDLERRFRDLEEKG